MRAVLLDTHAFVWLVAGDERLGTKSRRLVRTAARDGGLYLSAISPWEIAMLVSKGRLVLEYDVGDWIRQALDLPGIRLLPLSPEIAVASTRLPGELHPDPADRIIVATARAHRATLVSADSRLIHYGVEGHLKVADAEA